MNAAPRARVGLVGLSGYGGEICRLLRNEDDAPLGRTKLAAVFAPDAHNHAPLLAELERAGVPSVDSYEALLARDVDVIWLPVPIGLHRSMTEAALAAGKAVMLEKPVAGCVQDHLALLEARQRVGRPVLVGFQDVYAPGTAEIKRRLLAGDFGRPLRAAVSCCWPRPDAYYARNGWAGAMRRDGAWVLDSPLSNAMAHFVNLALFFLGPTFDEIAQPQAVSAELWRARPIENYDTCSLRITVDNGGSGLDLVVLYSHATTVLRHPAIEIDTDRGTLRWHLEGRTTFTPTTPVDSSETQQVVPPLGPRPHMARQLGEVVLGLREKSDPAAGAVATLRSSLAHSQVVSAVSQAAPVVDVPPEKVSVIEVDGERFREINGLADAITAACAARQTLGEQGFHLPTHTGRLANLAKYACFTGPPDESR